MTAAGGRGAVAGVPHPRAAAAGHRRDGGGAARARRRRRARSPPTAAQTWGFRTFGPLRVTGHRCGWQEGQCPPGAPWQIELSNPIDAAAFTQGHGARGAGAAGPRGLRPRPAARRPGPLEAAHDVPGDPRRVAARRVRPDPRRAGTPSPSPWGARSRRSPAAGGELVVLDPAAGPRLSVYSTGLATLKVTVHRVAPADWAAYRAFQQRAQRDRTLPVAAGNAGRRRARSPSRDRPTSSWRPPIDLAGRASRRPRARDRGRSSRPARGAGADAMAGPRDQVGPGHAHRPRRVRGCEPARRLGHRARRRPAARRGSRSSSSPGGARAQTGRRRPGHAGPGRARPRRSLARRGNDVALLPARTAWWDQTGWQRGRRPGPAALDGVRRSRPLSARARRRRSRGGCA